MKYRYTLLLFFSTFILSGNTAFAQLVGNNTFLHGRGLEVGLAPNGCQGNNVAVPAGYHTTTRSSICNGKINKMIFIGIYKLRNN